MKVVDASVVLTALVVDSVRGVRIRRELLETGVLCAPHVLDLEVLSGLRRLAASGTVDQRRARQAVGDLTELPVDRYPHAPFAARIWQLRDNLTPYDAAYAALAEVLDVPLMTADARLAGSPGIACEVQLFGEPE